MFKLMFIFGFLVGFFLDETVFVIDCGYFVYFFDQEYG